MTMRFSVGQRVRSILPNLPQATITEMFCTSEGDILTLMVLWDDETDAMCCAVDDVLAVEP